MAGTVSWSVALAVALALSTASFATAAGARALSPRLATLLAFAGVGFILLALVCAAGAAREREARRVADGA